MEGTICYVEAVLERWSLHLCEEPSAATIVFDVKNAISPLNSDLVLSIIYVSFTVYTLKRAVFFIEKST